MKLITGIVYMYTTADGRKYIGQTIRPKQRQAEHLKKAKEGSNLPFHQGLRDNDFKYDYTVLYTMTGADQNYIVNELNKKEVYWIAYHHTYLNGYNSTIGGAGVKKIGKLFN
ncbi:MAG: GIY-YIG nuclease family protein [Paraclostridium sp.]